MHKDRQTGTANIMPKVCYKTISSSVAPWPMSTMPGLCLFPPKLLETELGALYSETIEAQIQTIRTTLTSNGPVVLSL